MSSCRVRFGPSPGWSSWLARTRASAVRTPTALVRMAGASITRDEVPSGASRRRTEVALAGRGIGSVVSLSP